MLPQHRRCSSHQVYGDSQRRSTSRKESPTSPSERQSTSATRIQPRHVMSFFKIVEHCVTKGDVGSDLYGYIVKSDPDITAKSDTVETTYLYNVREDDLRVRNLGAETAYRDFAYSDYSRDSYNRPRRRTSPRLRSNYIVYIDVSRVALVRQGVENILPRVCEIHPRTLHAHPCTPDICHLLGSNVAS